MKAYALRSARKQSNSWSAYSKEAPGVTSESSGTTGKGEGGAPRGGEQGCPPAKAPAGGGEQEFPAAHTFPAQQAAALRHSTPLRSRTRRNE